MGGQFAGAFQPTDPIQYVNAAQSMTLEPARNLVPLQAQNTNGLALDQKDEVAPAIDAITLLREEAQAGDSSPANDAKVDAPKQEVPAIKSKEKAEISAVDYLKAKNEETSAVDYLRAKNEET